MSFYTRWENLLLIVVLGASCHPPGAQKDPNPSMEQGSDLSGFSGRSFLCNNPLPLSMEKLSFNLGSCAHQYSYVETARLRGGLKDLIDLDGQRRILVIGKEAMRSAAPLFSPKVNSRVLGLFRTNPQEQWDRILNRLQGKVVSPLQLTPLIAQTLDEGSYDLTAPIGQVAVRLAPIVAIASQAGSYVQLNRDSFFVNVGYKDGRNPQKDIRSGRSFARAKGRPELLDASDVDYLKGLNNVLLEPKKIRPFYRALLKLLTASDPSGFDDLEPFSQTIAADFAAVFTAELNRHIMTGFKPLVHPWEQDLMEATFVSAFVTHGKILYQKGILVAGSPALFFAQGCTGGGLGNTVADRRRLSRKISAFLWSQPDRQQVTRLANIIGASKQDDIFQALASILIDGKRSGFVLNNAREITEAAIEVFYKVYEESTNIKSALGPLPGTDSMMEPQ